MLCEIALRARGYQIRYLGHFCKVKLSCRFRGMSRVGCRTRVNSVGTGFVGLLLTAALAQGASPNKENIIRYLAGIEILRTADHLTVESKSAKYHALVQTTGVSASDATVFVEGYRDAPQKWKEINREMKNYIEEAYRDSTERKLTDERKTTGDH